MNKKDFAQLVRSKVFVDGSKATIALRGANEYRNAPWIFDFRKIVFDAEILSFISKEFWKRYEAQYPFQVGGMESASIPLITAIVMEGAARKKPIHGFYIRKSRKRDGLMHMFEGGLTDKPVIIVDDIINTGQSVNKQIVALRDSRTTVTDVFTLLAFRDMSAYTFAADSSVSIHSIIDLTDVGMHLLSDSAPEIPKDAFRTVWRFSAGRPRFNYVVEKSAPVLDDEALFFGSDDSSMWSLDQESGDVRWQFRTGPHPKGIFSTPAIHGHTVYFGAYDGTCYALEKLTGHIIWRHDEADWIGSSPSLAPELNAVFIGLENALPNKQGGIIALDMKTGTPLWSHISPEHTHGSPLYIREEGMIVIGSNDGVLYSYDAPTGKRRWAFRTNGAIKGSCAYDAARRLILFGSWDGKLYAVSATGTLVFHHQTHAPIFSTPLIVKNTAVIGSLDKTVYALDLDTGRVRWSFLTNGRIFSSPVIAEESLWIGSNDGRLYELNPGNGSLKKFFQASERIVNAVAYNPQTKRFFVPTVANEIYCIERSEKEQMHSAY